MYIEQQTSYSALIDFLLTNMQAEGWTQLARGISGGTLSGMEYLVMQSPVRGCVAFCTDFNTTHGVYRIQLTSFPEYNEQYAWDNQPLSCKSNTSSSYIGTQSIPLMESFYGFFWFNDRRVIIGMREQLYYYLAYAGMLLPYGDSIRYPYPLYAAGCGEDRYTALNDPTQTSMSYSYTGNEMFNEGNDRALLPNGEIVKPIMWPCATNGLGSLGNSLSGDKYLYPMIVTASTLDGYFGVLDGVHRVSGEGATPEDTITVGTDQYLIIPNVHRRGLGDFYAIKKA